MTELILAAFLLGGFLLGVAAHKQTRKDIEVLDAWYTELASRTNKLMDNMASMAAKLAKYLDELDEVNRKLEILKENLEDRDYEEMKDYLDKKWEDAVTDITSYDPFKVGDNR